VIALVISPTKSSIFHLHTDSDADIETGSSLGELDVYFSTYAGVNLALNPICREVFS